MRLLDAVVTVLAALGALAPALGTEGAAPAEPDWRVLQLPDGTRIRHALVLPDDWQPGRTVPAVLALPPGTQDERMVEEGLRRYWGAPAARRGYLVLSPASPDGRLFHEGADEHLPAFLAAVSARFPVEGGRFHLVGASSGGLSATALAVRHPELFHSLVVAPGGPPTPAVERGLHRLGDLPVRAIVGGADTRWVILARRMVDAVRATGGDSTLTVLAGEDHVAPSLDGGGPILDAIDGVRRELGLVGALDAPLPGGDGAGTFVDDEKTRVSELLDRLHAAASRADEVAYAACFTRDAVFLGTDPDERWPWPVFERYFRPRFEAGRGWTYVPVERHVAVTGDGTSAWFDEILTNEKYGTCRGTGLAVRAGDGWRVARYSLSFLIPNEDAAAVMDAVRGGSSTSAR